MLSSHIIQELKAFPDISAAYYFCNSHTSKSDLSSKIFRTLVLQLLRAHTDFAAYISDKYVQEGCAASMPELRKLLRELPKVIGPVRLVVDGLDECGLGDQRQILHELLELLKDNEDKIKILLSSREGVYISKRLKKVPTISLTDNSVSVERDIHLYVRQHLLEIRSKGFHQHIIDEIELSVVKKAKGTCYSKRVNSS